MDYQQMKGMRISRMTLGTVQLGLDYGITETAGKPTQEKAHQILQAAVDQGISVFDTAQGYGNSEEIIGSYLKSSDATPTVVTKIPKVALDADSSFETIYNHSKAAVLGSAERLGLSQIPLYLMHKPEDMTDYDGKVTDSLVKLKQDGLVSGIGVSVYTPEDVRQFLDLGVFDAIQIPMNMFDHTLLRMGLLDELESKGVIVFCRSVFLKGLFFMDPDKLPPYIVEAEEPLRRFRALLDDCKIPVAQLALSFIRDLSAINSLVLGVDNVEQLEENVRLINSPPLPEEVKQRILTEFADIPVEVTNPFTWDQRKAAMGL